MGVFDESEEIEKFEFVVEDVFKITGRGIVATGYILSGEVSVGDIVHINDEIDAEVRGIEAFRKLMDTARKGDNVGLLLGNIERTDVNRRRFNYKIKL